MPLGWGGRCGENILSVLYTFIRKRGRDRGVLEGGKEGNKGGWGERERERENGREIEKDGEKGKVEEGIICFTNPQLSSFRSADTRGDLYTRSTLTLTGTQFQHIHVLLECCWSCLKTESLFGTPCICCLLNGFICPSSQHDKDCPLKPAQKRLQKVSYEKFKNIMGKLFPFRCDLDPHVLTFGNILYMSHDWEGSHRVHQLSTEENTVLFFHFLLI